jgi:hypothetical protein
MKIPKANGNILEESQLLAVNEATDQALTDPDTSVTVITKYAQGKWELWLKVTKLDQVIDEFKLVNF